MTAEEVTDWLEANPRGRLQVFAELAARGFVVTPMPLGSRGEKILNILDRRGPLPTTVLAELIRIRPQHVWSALRYLEARGLVRPVGKAEHPGGAGRSPTLWESVR